MIKNVVDNEGAGLLESYKVDTSFTRAGEQSEVWKMDNKDKGSD